MTPEQELQLIQTLARIEERTDDMHDRLFGNGQPGYVEKHDMRLDKLEDIASKVKGAMYMLSTLFTLLTGWMGVHTFKGK